MKAPRNYCLFWLAIAAFTAAPTLAQTPTTPTPVSSSSSNSHHPHLEDTTGDTCKRLLHDFTQHATLASSFKPVMSKLWLDPHERSLFWRTLQKAVRWEDLVLIAAAGWLTVPAIEWPYKQLVSRVDSSTANSSNKQSSLTFQKTWMYTVADHVQQISKIALLIYAVDLIKLLLMVMGFDFWKLGSLPHAFAQSTYTAWLANRLSVVKRSSLRKYVNRRPETWGRMQIVNRLIDAALYGGTVVIILNILQVQMGVAMSSFLAFGSVGTLAAGLASQGVAKEILHGLMLASSDRLYEGDTVQFKGGVSGTIVELGWMETVLRGSDEIMLTIPNTEMVKQQVSNLSRVRYSQVKQTLHFAYSDSEKLREVMDTIKQEIRKACPELITDGSRPFRVHWSSYEKAHLEVIVDAHFRIRPIGDEYWANRQAVLEAIHRAVKQHEVQLAAVK